MNIYVVILPVGSALSMDDVDAAFPGDSSYPVNDRTFLVASAEHQTAKSVSAAIGIGPTDERNRMGLVAKMPGAYAGYASRALWDQLEAWENQ